MNRTTLLTPALCGNLDEKKITHALGLARHDDLEIWEQGNIPYTIRKKRQAFFEVVNPKIGNDGVLITG